ESAREARRMARCPRGAEGRPRHVHARCDGLGRRGAPRHRGAGELVARRAHRDGGEPSFRRPGDDGDEDLRAPLGLAELDLPAPERGRRARRAHHVWAPRAARVRLEENVSSVVNSERIPNNVNLSDDKKLQRALEAWQPKFIDWWKEMGPEGFQADDVYLRT